ncbi:MAG: chromosome segregation protein SMC, partial [Bacteroidota bacterium]
RTFISNDIQRLTDQIAANTRTVASLEMEVDGYQTDLNYERNVEADLESALENARKRLDEVRSSHNLMKGNLDEFVREQQTVEREIVELEKTRAIQASQIENLRRDVERTLNDIAARKEEMNALELRLREQSEA